jgi:Fe-S-cluster-containing dehydrogenase component/DMSO reductase anchor subunit
MTSLVPNDARTLIDELLEEQQRLTAVEQFAWRKDHQVLAAQTKLYRELLPARSPGPGQQYAFAVDLDSCSGCKACVTACHSLNGLDEDETWRSVGLLHGVAGGAPVQRTVTTACHHCVEPACLEGCPVLAYEKDPVTGIVRHLDDQCIGCQYCILKCPYDVPQYSAKRGIVRKCDMCSDRLAVGEAPACAQACPNGAITITLVDKAAIAAAAQRGEFLPGAPDPGYTLPTTRYHTTRELPPSLVPADQHDLKPGRSHPPLVIMLVLTQLSVGAACVETGLRMLFPANLMTQLSSWHALVALGIGVLALGASTLHLGRPRYAWRALAGLKTSWLSREILGFGLFAALASFQAAAGWWPALRGLRSPGLGAAVSLSGLLGVFCSLMVYRDTRRPFWSGATAALKFLGTTALLGTVAILFVTTWQALLFPAIASHGAYRQLTVWLATALAAITAVKLGVEAGILRHLLEPRASSGAPALAGSSPDLLNPRASSLRRTALLLTGELAEITIVRVLLGLIGGVLLPVAFLVRNPAPGAATLGITVWMLVFSALGELLERYLFFVAAVPAKMPGGIGT